MSDDISRRVGSIETEVGGVNLVGVTAAVTVVGLPLTGLAGEVVGVGGGGGGGVGSAIPNTPLYVCCANVFICAKVPANGILLTI